MPGEDKVLAPGFHGCTATYSYPPGCLAVGTVTCCVQRHVGGLLAVPSPSPRLTCQTIALLHDPTFQQPLLVPSSVLFQTRPKQSCTTDPSQPLNTLATGRLRPLHLVFYSDLPATIRHSRIAVRVRPHSCFPTAGIAFPQSFSTQKQHPCRPVSKDSLHQLPFLPAPRSIPSTLPTF
ncbi:uncharacterized protein BDZ99DRAFT_11255 [Mytilinidion resinicola]|uniref:Uncharacterized protein n=1 Tax=Mytilinidion resinicola TaxID=574789 RepID=A0A6A6Z889_9PEZI|nr:uncharacterized protein BDZ99DRAFT_11255 [Mytilinidion resinicola]KAF2817220.1 hypothetical protein BDZ99DRAFT_11255 [Mytilinidion resinicola]